MDVPSQRVTELLVKWRAGDEDALQALVPSSTTSSGRLRTAICGTSAGRIRCKPKRWFTRRTCACSTGDQLTTENRAHFVAVAARLMRQILVDHARSHQAAKRGSGQQVELTLGIDAPQSRPVDVVALDDALNALSRRDPQQSRIVELRFFGGLTIEEAAAALDISPATVKRDWAMARAWLSREMKKGGHGRGTME